MDDDGHQDGGQEQLVELVGGPWDGHRQVLATAAELNGPREGLGALMVVDGWTDRALYEPD
ncbi:hypothetical protein ACSNOI_46065, partial [Actinomadura kijaniata]|uniref:hypothetical protein n=1 Tax=Actinomadura kijaniata TaxID=46161 RepID=UPI003F1A1ACA